MKHDYIKDFLNTVKEYDDLKKNTFWQIKKSKIREFKNRYYIFNTNMWKLSHKHSMSYKIDDTRGFTQVFTKFELYVKNVDYARSDEFNIKDFKYYFKPVKGNAAALIFGK